MAVLFAILITLQFGLSNNSIQANTIYGAMQEAFSLSQIAGGITLQEYANLNRLNYSSASRE